MPRGICCEGARSPVFQGSVELKHLLTLDEIEARAVCLPLASRLIAHALWNAMPHVLHRAAEGISFVFTLTLHEACATGCSCCYTLEQ